MRNGKHLAPSIHRPAWLAAMAGLVACLVFAGAGQGQDRAPSASEGDAAQAAPPAAEVQPATEAPLATEAQPAAEAPPAAETQPASEPDPAAAAQAADDSLPWLATLAEGRRQAQANEQPLLVRGTADWCGWCRKLEEQLATEEVQRELQDWTLVLLDIDDYPAEARALGIAGIPVMVALTPQGEEADRLLGFAEAEVVLEWLEDARKPALAQPADLLVEEDAPNAFQVSRLLSHAESPDPLEREVAIERLVENPDVSLEATTTAFSEGNLARRLAAYEVLRQWQAPLEDLDPWRPDTFTEERVNALLAWAGDPEKLAALPDELSEEELSDVQTAIDLLLAASPEDTWALYARLARYRQLLLPEVYRRLGEVESDQDRERLTTLRYYLLASRKMTLTWPDGLAALASGDLEVRRRTAERFAARASAEDEALLMELFSDADALVREISLRGLSRMGGATTTEAFTRLLHDNDPNVRAAVLKQLGESAENDMVVPVAEYVQGEEDADLVVHAVRFLRAVPNNREATQCLLTLVKHPNWQVRAEVAEALGEVAQSLRYTPNDSLRSEAFSALFEFFDDEDGFVVSRALTASSSAPNLPLEGVLQVIEKHPELAETAVKALASSSDLAEQAMPHLREYAQHDQASVRRAALLGLSRIAPRDMSEELLSGLSDDDAKVRIAAAMIFVSAGDYHRDLAAEAAQPNNTHGMYHDEVIIVDAHDTSPSLLERTFDMLLGRSRPNSVVGEAEGEATELEEATDALDAEESSGQEPAQDPAPDEDPEAPVEGVAEPAEQAILESTEDTLEPAGELGDETSEATPAPSASELTPAEERNAKDPTAPLEQAAAEPAAAEGEGSGQQAAPSAEADATPSIPGVHPLDAWLAEFQSGVDRPEWFTEASEPLSAMLAGDSPEERLWAGLGLLLLGEQTETVTAELLQLARDHQALRPQVVRMLVWLPEQPRLQAFAELRKLELNEEAMYSLSRSILTIPSEKNLQAAWEMLADDSSDDIAYTLHGLMLQGYLGDRYYRPFEAPQESRNQLETDATHYVREGVGMQPAIALSLLASAQSEEVSTLFEELWHAPETSSTLRDDLLRVMLATLSETRARDIVNEALAADDEALQRTALQYLAMGQDSIRTLHGGLPISVSGSYISSSSGTRAPIVPEAPAGVSVELLRPFLASEDLETVAIATYLLVLLDEPVDLEPLLEYRQQMKDNSMGDSWNRLAYRAIAYKNDPTQVGVVEDIYESMKNRPYMMREFYWTIRIMSGPDILELRSRIRDEQGTENL